MPKYSCLTKAEGGGYLCPECDNLLEKNDEYICPVCNYTCCGDCDAVGSEFDKLFDDWDDYEEEE